MREDLIRTQEHAIQYNKVKWREDNQKCSGHYTELRVRYKHRWSYVLCVWGIQNRGNIGPDEKTRSDVDICLVLLYCWELDKERSTAAYFLLQNLCFRSSSSRWNIGENSPAINIKPYLINLPLQNIWLEVLQVNT